MRSQEPSAHAPSRAHHLTGPLGFLNPTAGYCEPVRGKKTTRTTSNGSSPAAKPADGGDAKLGDDTAAGTTTTTASGGRQEKQEEEDGTGGGSGVYQLWRSRDNRKGRHAVVVVGDGAGKGLPLRHPGATSSLRQTLKGVWKMVVRYPVWDVSFDVAYIFTIGSVVWVINGFFVWLPSQDPWTEFPTEVEMGGGVTAFLGATIFEIGSVLLMLEAVNENRADCFGWALEEAAMESRSLLLRPDPDGCSHAHRHKSTFLAGGGSGGSSSTQRQGWQWWPSWDELTTHYFREIGFLACLSQFIGASIFWIAGLTGLPPIYDALSVPVANGIYWLPQVVGGTGFIVSSWLFMLETQPKWYVPALNVLGWHIGFWNLIGALGFTLCGALGFASENEAAAYASVLATFIGSWAFLIGSIIQWYESLNKYPVEIHTSAEKNLSE